MTDQTTTTAGGSGVADGPALTALAERVLQVRGEAVETVGRLPRVTRWLLPLVAVLCRGEAGSTVEPGVRQALLLRAAAANGPGPWLERQRATAALAGLSEDEIRARTHGPLDAPALSDRERTAMRWAELVTANEAKRDPVAYAELRQHFTDAELVELTGAVGLSAFLDRFTRATTRPGAPAGIILGDDGAAEPIEPARLREWSAAMFGDRRPDPGPDPDGGR